MTNLFLVRTLLDINWVGVKRKKREVLFDKERGIRTDDCLTI